MSALVPGVYCLMLASLLVALLRRWFDPLPGRVLALFAVVLLVLFGRALFLGGVLLPLDMLRSTPPFQDEAPGRGAFVLQGDLIEDFVPYSSQVRRVLRRGEWPLLNELVGAGEPLLANSQAQAFHPLSLLTYPLPLAQAVGVVSALKVLLALLFGFLFLRRMALGVEPAALGATCFGLCGFVMMYLGWPHTHSAVALPMLLYALDRCLVGGLRRDLALVAVAMATLVLGGHPETVVYTAGAGAAFGLVRAWQTRSFSGARARLLRCLAAAALGALVTAPVMLPAALFQRQSERRLLLDVRRPAGVLESVRSALADGRRRETAAGVERRAVPVLAPFALGSELRGAYWGATASTQDLGAFAGTVALLLAPLALWPTRRRSPGEWVLAAVGAVALIVFVQPPGLTALMARIPLLASSASYNRRAAYLTAFALSYLAAASWHRLRKGEIPRWPLLASGGIAIALLVGCHLANPDPQHAGRLEGFRLSWLLAQSAVVALALVLLLLPASRGVPTSSDPVLRRALPLALPALAALELVVGFAPFQRAEVARLFFPQDPGIAFLQNELGDQRLVALDDVFRYNVPTVYGLADVRSGNPLQPAAMSLLTLPLRPSLGDRRFSVADHPLYDLLGVRFVVAEPGRELPAPLESVYQGDFWVWRRGAPLPRLFLPATAVTAEGRQWRTLTAATERFDRSSVVEPAPGHRDDWQAERPDQSTLAIERLLPTRVAARVDLVEPRLLASSLYQDGGWHVLVDGAPLPTVRTNGAMVGAWLPAGAHSLDLVYRPPGFVLGCLLAGLAVAGAAAWLLPVPSN